MKVEQIPKPVRDSIYVAIGLPIVAAGELRSWISGRQAGDQMKAMDARLAELEAYVEDTLDRIQAQLPDPARDLMSRTRDVTRDARTQLRSLVERAA
jgi:hypothetical protein